MVTIIVGALALAMAIYAVLLLRAATRAGQLGLRMETAALGAVTNFFDTLGIGSFAPTTSLSLPRLMRGDTWLWFGRSAVSTSAPRERSASTRPMLCARVAGGSHSARVTSRRWRTGWTIVIGERAR